MSIEKRFGFEPEKKQIESKEKLQPSEEKSMQVDREQQVKKIDQVENHLEEIYPNELSKAWQKEMERMKQVDIDISEITVQEMKQIVGLFKYVDVGRLDIGLHFYGKTNPKFLALCRTDNNDPLFKPWKIADFDRPGAPQRKFVVDGEEKKNGLLRSLNARDAEDALAHTNTTFYEKLELSKKLPKNKKKRQQYINELYEKAKKIEQEFMEYTQIKTIPELARTRRISFEKAKNMVKTMRVYTQVMDRYSAEKDLKKLPENISIEKIDWSGWRYDRWYGYGVQDENGVARADFDPDNDWTLDNYEELAESRKKDFVLKQARLSISDLQDAEGALTPHEDEGNLSLSEQQTDENLPLSNTPTKNTENIITRFFKRFLGK